MSYCVSKAALLQLARCLDEELAPNVRVGSVMPGVVDTDMQAELRTLDFQSVQFFRDLGNNTSRNTAWAGAGSPPEQALDKPENVADFLVWLLLDVDPHDFGGREWDINSPGDQQSWLQARRA